MARRAVVAGRQDFVLISLRLFLKKIPGRHADHARGNAFGHQFLISVQRHGNLRAGGDQDHVRPFALGIGKDVSPLRQTFGGSVLFAVNHRKLLPRQRQRHRAVVPLNRHAPRHGGFIRIGRPDERKIRNRAQRRKLLDGLMRRSVLSKKNAVVRVNKDGMDPHHGRKADSGPHIIRKDHERGPIRNQSAQGHAIQRGTHRMLTNSKMEVAAAVVPFLKGRFTLDQRVGGRRQVRRTAQQRGQAGRNGVQHLAGCLAGRQGAVGRLEGGNL